MRKKARYDELLHNEAMYLRLKSRIELNDARRRCAITFLAVRARMLLRAAFVKHRDLEPEQRQPRESVSSNGSNVTTQASGTVAAITMNNSLGGGSGKNNPCSTAQQLPQPLPPFKEGKDYPALHDVVESVYHFQVLPMAATALGAVATDTEEEKGVGSLHHTSGWNQVNVLPCVQAVRFSRSFGLEIPWFFGN